MKHLYLLNLFLFLFCQNLFAFSLGRSVPVDINSKVSSLDLSYKQMFAMAEVPGSIKESNKTEVASGHQVKREIDHSSMMASKFKLSVVFFGIFLVFSMTLYIYDRKIGVKLNIKLVGGITSLLLIIVVILAYADTTTKSIGEKIEILAEEFIPLNKVIANITEHQLQEEIHLERYLRNHDAEEYRHVKEISEKIDQELNQATLIVQSWVKSAKTTDEQRLAKEASVQVESLKNEHKKFETACQDAMNSKIDASDFEQKIKTCHKNADVIEEHLDHFFHYVELQVDDATHAAEQYEVESEAMLFAIGVGSVFFGIFVLYLIWHASVGLIKNVKESADTLVASAGSVSASSVQFKANSEKLAAMTQQQAAGVQEIMATLDQLTAMAAKNIEQTVLSTEKAKECTNAATQGQRSLEKVSTSMDRISSENENVTAEIKNSNQKMSEISAIIEEITRKTNIINDIVFQTKLLSFNASVEAARAGDQGKGFAVVAQEVGNLARMSGEAANEIRQMLSESNNKVRSIVQESSSKVDVLVEKSKRTIQDGHESIEESKQLFDRLLADIASVDSSMAEIAAATKEQSSGVDAIGIALREIDTGTQEVAGVSHEAASASEELSCEAANLQRSSGNLILLIAGQQAKAA